MLKLKRNKSNCIFNIMRSSKMTNNLDSEINNEESNKNEVYEQIKTNRNEDNINSSHSNKKSENEKINLNYRLLLIGEKKTCWFFIVL